MSARDGSDLMADETRFRSQRDPDHAPSRPPESGRRRGPEDPLAELARLIGQEDPFADFTGGARPRARASLPSPDHRTARQEPRYDPRHDDRDRERRRESYRTRGDGDGYDRPSTRDTRSAYSYGATPRPEREPEDRAAPADGTYARRLEVRDPLPARGKETNAAYDTTGASKYDPEYSDDAYLPEHAEEVIEDAQPRRSRTGLAIVAAVVGIAIVGTAGVFGYRAVFGPSAGRQPPVIGPQAGPNKVAPAGPATPESTKQFNDRVGGPSERIMPRDETPIDVTARTGRPPVPGAAPAVAPSPAPAGPAVAPVPQQPAAFTEGPRRVRTVTVRADGTVIADPTPAPAAPARVAPAPTAAPARPGAPPMAVNTYAPPAEDPEPEATPPPPPATRGRVSPAPAATPAPAARAPTSGPVWPPVAQPTAAQPTGPVTAQVRVQTQAPAIQTPPPPPAGYVVQVSSQRTEAEAQAAWQNLQSRYSSVLAGRQATIRRADLGDRGTFYRAQIGPFGNRDDANQLCLSLKSAGGECVVQRN
jgi:hypothetical protein